MYICIHLQLESSCYHYVCMHVGECCAADYQFGVTSQVSVSEDIQDKIQVG